MNPLKGILEQKNLKATEMAFMAGVDVSVIYGVVHGRTRKIPKTILRAIESLGYDSEMIQESYNEWRTEKAKKILETKVI